MSDLKTDLFSQFNDPAEQGKNQHTTSVAVPSMAAAVKPLGDNFPIKNALAIARAAAKPLTKSQRETIVEQALRSIEHLYAHLFLKRARHAYDPVTALQRLKRVCADLDTDLEFHTEMLSIFKRLRDIHTGYILPFPYDRLVAFLPFTVVRCSQNGSPESQRNSIVAGILPGFKHDTFTPGVRIVGWNGIPIDDAINRVGADQQGANPNARMAYGSLFMTIRWLGSSIPPDDLWVTVAYLDDKDDLHEIRFQWRVLMLPDATDPASQAFPPIQALSVLNSHLDQSNLQRPVSVERGSLTSRSFARLMFRDTEADDAASPRKGKQSKALKAKRSPKDGEISKRSDVETQFPETISAEKIRCIIDGKEREFGRIRLRHFIYPDTETYLKEFLRVLGEMPKSGLVIDIRGNGGGTIPTAERIIRSLKTDGYINPLPFQFRATPTVAEIASTKTFKADPAELPGWEGRISPLIEDAAQFSLSGHMTEAHVLNDLPDSQRYDGPVALLTDAMTYSAGDMFAASFQDHDIGKIVGVDSHTGGGGANLWFHNVTVECAENQRMFSKLPGGVQLHYAVRRCLRVGADNYGLPFEEDGVRPDTLRSLTEADLYAGAEDLLMFTAQTYLFPK
ncbi:MAG: S41 family peptidase [Paracoccaceae bacterium]